MKEISGWLGHADIGTSMNLYAHVDNEAKKETANMLESMLFQKKQKKEESSKNAKNVMHGVMQTA